MVANAYGGVHAPDIVGNIRVDQAWGLFQLSGAAHEVNASYNNLNAGRQSNALRLEISGHPDTKWGGSVMAALQIKNIPDRSGRRHQDRRELGQGRHQERDLHQRLLRRASRCSAAAALPAYQSVWLRCDHGWRLPSRPANGGNGSIHLTEAFGVRGAFNHNWDPYWSTSLFGATRPFVMTALPRPTLRRKYIATIRVLSADFSCNPDFNVGMIGVVTPLDSRQEPDVLGRSHCGPISTRSSRDPVLSPTAPKPTARLRVQGPGHRVLQRSRSA